MPVLEVVNGAGNGEISAVLKLVAVGCDVGRLNLVVFAALNHQYSGRQGQTAGRSAIQLGAECNNPVEATLPGGLERDGSAGIGADQDHVVRDVETARATHIFN